MSDGVKNAFAKLVRGGLSPLRRKLWAVRHLRQRDREYTRWVEAYGSLPEARHTAIQHEAASMDGPLISVVMPVYNVDERWLRVAVESVITQLYPNWELCIADDASTAPHIRPLLEEFAVGDPRIRGVFRERNGNISAASNSALELATGEFVALMDHDDVLSEDALFQVATVLARKPETDLVYTDEDKIDERGRRFHPMIKPDWSPEMMLSINLVTHLCVFRRSIIREIGGFREGFEGSQDYDLALRFIERTASDRIKHIPHILYHWRAIPGSVALASGEKNYAHDRARIALNEHFERVGISAHSVPGVYEIHRAKYAVPSGMRISVIGNGSRIGQLIQPACDAQFEIIELDNNADYAELNRAAVRSTGDVLIFVAGAIRDAAYGWAEELAVRAMLDGVGAVGGKIADAGCRILHTGYLLGVAGGVGRAHYGYPADFYGEFVRLAVDQNFSAVSVDLMAVRRELFLEVGGFKASDFPHSGADIDLCLRLAASGHRTVWTPWASITADAVRPVPSGECLDRLRERWPDAFERDPFYNPNLTLENEDLGFAFPPRVER